MANLDEQTGDRKRVSRDGQQYYFFISDSDIMFSGPNEGDIMRQDEYSPIFAICRLVSVARAAGVEWKRILKQLDGANMTGNRTWVRKITATESWRNRFVAIHLVVWYNGGNEKNRGSR
jgi:hypothetical protein